MVVILHGLSFVNSKVCSEIQIDLTEDLKLWNGSFMGTQNSCVTFTYIDQCYFNICLTNTLILVLRITTSSQQQFTSVFVFTLYRINIKTQNDKRIIFLEEGN